MRDSKNQRAKLVLHDPSICHLILLSIKIEIVAAFSVLQDSSKKQMHCIVNVMGNFLSNWGIVVLLC